MSLCDLQDRLPGQDIPAGKVADENLLADFKRLAIQFAEIDLAIGQHVAVGELDS